MRDLEKMNRPTFKELSKLYKDYFSFGYINSDINAKLAIISLLGYIVTELKKKNPDVTYFSVLTKITSGLGIPEEFIWAIAIVSEDFAYGCTEFPTFGMKPNQMVNKIKEILSLYTPF